MLIGSIFGVVILYIICDKTHLLVRNLFKLTITSYEILLSSQNDRFIRIVNAIDEIIANVVSTIIYIYICVRYVYLHNTILRDYVFKKSSRNNG